MRLLPYHVIAATRHGSTIIKPGWYLFDTDKGIIDLELGGPLDTQEDAWKAIGSLTTSRRAVLFTSKGISGASGVHFVVVQGHAIDIARRHHCHASHRNDLTALEVHATSQQEAIEKVKKMGLEPLYAFL